MYRTLIIISILFGIGIHEKFTNGVPLESAFAGNSDVTRIVGGVDAPQAYAPHMAALIDTSHPFSGQFLVCGGTIVTDRHILTAAHCIDVFLKNGTLIPSYVARVGSNQWNSGGILAEFESYKNHPLWDPINMKYDIGVLTLKKKLKLNKSVGVVALSYDHIDGEQRSYVTGWGRTGPQVDGDVVHMAPIPDNLQLLYLETVTTERCIKAIDAVVAAGGWAFDLNPLVEICAFHSVGHGVCSGDAGSALMTLDNRKQVGVVSWGFPCAIGTPDVYTRISGMQDFLDPIIHGNVAMQPAF